MADTAPPNSESDIRPIVRTSGSGNAGLWFFLVLLLLGGYFLFSALQSNRLSTSAPATSFDTAGSFEQISAPPPLALPNGFAEPFATLPEPAIAEAPAPASPPTVITRIVEVPAEPIAAPIALPPPPPQPAIIYDAEFAPRVPQAPADQSGDRVLASRLANPSYTIPKGAVIPAVLESAMDSTRPGYVRALVSRNVSSFDGSRVLIPRGSRLYGEYAADLNYGQDRALVIWTRLLRPDGVTIELNSPAADPLGRAGVGGDVNTHFFARFGAAILQSSLDVGVGLATRSVAGDGVYVNLPGTTQNYGNASGSGSGSVGQMATEGLAPVRPTLEVDQGTSVSVFVSRDLDFSTVDE